MNTTSFHVCESAHSTTPARYINYTLSDSEDRPISKDDSFDDCVILSKESFDPDAVFLGDIVDDEVLPYANLAVDGLTSRRDAADGKLELRPDDVAESEPIPASTTMPVAILDSDHLDVYGWESSLWRKIKDYFGL